MEKLADLNSPHFSVGLEGWKWMAPAAPTTTLDGLWCMALERAVRALASDILTRIIVEQQKDLTFKRLW